jgi:RNA-binding protein
MTTLDITSSERSTLRAAAHPLKPVVLIGDKGLTDAVLKEIDRALTAHELIKVRAGSAERADRDELLNKICDTLSCASVHHLGKMLILFRPGAESTYLAPPKPVRTKRKANEPHTPKKLAAAGKKLTKPSRRASRAEEKPDEKPKFTYSAVFSGDRDRRPSTRADKTESGHGIPRRSAMSLRSGARRGAAGSPARKRTTVKR